MKIFYSIIFLFLFNIVYAQENRGLIIEIDDNIVYLDITNANAKVGDQYKVVKKGGTMVHPITKEVIQKKDELVCILTINDVADSYSTATVKPESAIHEISIGTPVVALSSDDKSSLSGEFRESIAVLPFNIPGTKAGYIGIYASEVLAQELFSIDKFNIIDRQTLNLQLDEIAKGEIVAEDEALQFGKTKGVKYFITGTFYEPDVAETSTGVPIKGILTAAELVTGENLGADYASNVEVKNLKATVKITLKVVDVETGAVQFMCTEMAQASGKSQVNLERGLLGGAKINGGATAFANTITGQATLTATKVLTNDLVKYFDGEIKTKVYKGNIVNSGTKAKKQNDKIVNGIEKNKLPIYNIEIINGDTIATFKKLNKNSHYILYMPELVRNRNIVKDNMKINIKDYRYREVGSVEWNKPKSGKLLLNNTYQKESLKDSLYIKVRKKFINSVGIGLLESPAHLYEFKYYPFIKRNIGLYTGFGVLFDGYSSSFFTGLSLNAGYTIHFGYNSGVSIGFGVPFGKSDYSDNYGEEEYDYYSYFKYQVMMDAGIRVRFLKAGIIATLGLQQYPTGYYYEYDDERTIVRASVYFGICL